jgi:hypothetical protein
MKKHLQVKDLVALLQDVNNTMGDDSYVVVVVDGHEYPVVGVETYDGVFANVVLGKDMTDEMQAKIERRDGDVYVVV